MLSVNTTDKTMEDFSRYTKSYSNKHLGEQQEIAQEHIQRAKQGKEVWNAWAENFKRYTYEKNVYDAFIDFRSLYIHFDLDVEFSGFIFPCNTDFRESDILSAMLFDDAKFYGDVDFSGLTFSGSTIFKTAKFMGNAFFMDTTFRETDFSNSIFDQKANFMGANFSEKVDFDLLQFKDGANFQGVDLKHANIKSLNLSNCNFTDASLIGALIDGRTNFQGSNMGNCKVDRYQLERMDNYGGLSNSDRMDMIIEDGLALLQNSYSGFWQNLHLLALLAFAAPYLWFISVQWINSSFNFSQDPSLIPVWKALFQFIYNGGVNWHLGYEFHWSFVIFIILLIYNLLRGLLLWKTISLTLQKESSGLHPPFSLKKYTLTDAFDYLQNMKDILFSHIYEKKLLFFLYSIIRRWSWSSTYSLSELLFKINLILICINIIHFLNQTIKIPL